MKAIVGASLAKWRGSSKSPVKKADQGPVTAKLRRQHDTWMASPMAPQPAIITPWTQLPPRSASTEPQSWPSGQPWSPNASANPPETALTLGRFVARSSARAKARRLGTMDEAQEAAERNVAADGLKPQVQTVRLLGCDIPVLPAADGTLRAEDDGKPASAKGVQSYIARAFGDRLGAARAAMEALATSLPSEELNRVGFRLYDRLQPDAPVGAAG